MTDATVRLNLTWITELQSALQSVGDRYTAMLKLRCTLGDRSMMVEVEDSPGEETP